MHFKNQFKNWKCKYLEEDFDLLNIGKDGHEKISWRLVFSQAFLFIDLYEGDNGKQKIIRRISAIFNIDTFELLKKVFKFCWRI